MVKCSQLTIILLILTITVSSLLITSASAQSITTPSKPEFAVQLDEERFTVTVKNQPVIQNGDATAGIFYEIRMKWHEQISWFPEELESNEHGYIPQTSYADTTIWIDSPDSINELLGPSETHQVDYQIRAINGYRVHTLPSEGPPFGYDPNDYDVAVVDTSEWSAQTVTIPVKPQPQDIMAPVVIAGLIAAIVIVSLFAYLAKHKRWK